MNKRRYLTRALSIGLLASAIAVQAQTTPSHASKPAPNAWMLTPTPYLEWNKDISPSLRTERDRFWDEVTHREWPLTVKREDGAFGGPDGFDDGKQSEIPDVPDRVIVTATFTKARSVLSASEKSIYTEITMHLDQVFEDKTGSGRLAPHEDITLMMIGGTVALRSGRTLSDHVEPSELSLQPNRSYLLVLQYQKDGDWYELDEDWDVTDGVVRGNSGRTQYLAKHGRSLLDGLPVQQISAALSRELDVSK